MLRPAIANGGEGHDEKGEDGHLPARIATGPSFGGVANAKECIEDGQDEAENIAQNQCVLHARECIPFVHGVALLYLLLPLSEFLEDQKPKRTSKFLQATRWTGLKSTTSAFSHPPTPTTVMMGNATTTTSCHQKERKCSHKISHKKKELKNRSGYF